MKSLFSRLRGHNAALGPSSPSRSHSTLSHHDKENLELAVAGHDHSAGAVAAVTAAGTTTVRESKSRSSFLSRSRLPSSSSQSLRTLSPTTSTVPFDKALPIPNPDDDHTQSLELSAWETNKTKSRQRTYSSEAIKKVTFISPAPTPSPNTLQESDSHPSLVPPPVPPKSSVSVSPVRPSQPLPTSPTRSSTAASLRPRPNSRSSSFYPRKVSASSLTSSATVNTPSSTPMTAFSPAPSYASMTSTQSYLPPPASWSETIDDELIANLGPRERIRQEVLWEIVSSEERYVHDLVKLEEIFCRPLLPPSESAQALNLPDPLATLTGTLSPTISSPALSPASTSESFDYLPIAAQYSSGLSRRSVGSLRSPESSSDSTTLPTAVSSSSARMKAYLALTHGEPKRQSSVASLAARVTSRSHRSLPPPARGGSAPAINHRMQSQTKADEAPHSRLSSRSSIASQLNAPGPIVLPDDLERVLGVLSNGILHGHIKLVTALRRRYDNQYPLVRSLADVFTSHSYILREYATYVLHLERALAQVDEALATAEQMTSGGKRLSRRLEDTDLGRLGKLLSYLEEVAAERGEAGLAISLSKSFQRLLKYPLLFQNLLFNTDPSTREYEATLAMVEEVELIVRSIEDEKSSSEEREKTRDVWARIDGVEKEKMLVAPKPTRLLVGEALIDAPALDNATSKDATVKRRSNNRLSDILKGGHKPVNELWIVGFTDVSLLCEKVGTTTFPMSAGKFTSSRSESHNDISSKRLSTASRRHQSLRARNLYRFVKVHEWHGAQGQIANKDLARNSFIEEMDESGASFPRMYLGTPRRSPNATPHATPTKVPLKSDDSPSRPTPRSLRTATHAASVKSSALDDSASTSDHASVMSFAFNGAEVRPNARSRIPKSAIPQPAQRPNSTLSSATRASLQRRTSGTGSASGMASSAANAKFANRLRPSDDVAGNGNPSNRASNKSRRSLPPAMVSRSTALLAADKNISSPLSPSSSSVGPLRSRNVTPTNIVKPAWNASMKPEGKPQSKTFTPATTVASHAGSMSSRRTTPSQTRLAPRPARASAPPEVSPSGVAHSRTDSSATIGLGLWTAYQNASESSATSPSVVAIDSLATPKRIVVRGRDVGGRI